MWCSSVNEIPLPENAQEGQHQPETACVFSPLHHGEHPYVLPLYVVYQLHSWQKGKHLTVDVSHD